MDFTKSLMVIAVLAVVVSIIGLAAITDKVGKISGLALSSQGNATLTVLKTASISFTNNLLNWSIGLVNTSCGGQPFAELNSIGRLNCSYDTGAAATTWDNVSRGLVIENDGSADVKLNLTSQYNATQFIGPLGATLNLPLFEWRPNMGIAEDPSETAGNPDGEANSCCPVIDGSCTATGLAFVGWQPVAWEQPAPASAPARICNNFTNGANYGLSNEIEIDVELQIPSNAPPGGKLTIITATAQAL